MTMHHPSTVPATGKLPCPGPEGSREAWLDYLFYLHDQRIDLGLDRMRDMVARLGIDFSGRTVVTVGGTNGKGSTVTMLESIYRHAGYKTGLHTSPHLIDFAERCVVAGRPVDDKTLVDAFMRVEKARDGLSLSFFEYTLLAFFLIFMDAECEVVILEVGLGGRLDATNVIDSDAAVVVTVGIDHVGFLGSTREAIGAEKAPIYRPGRPAVCTDPEPPQSLVDYVEKIGASPSYYLKDFRPVVHEDGTWDYEGPAGGYKNLPAPALKGRNQYQNASGVLTVVERLMDRVPVSEEAVREGLVSVRLPGRFEERRFMDADFILDVGHNPHAARVLFENLEDERRRGVHLIALCGMLKDKDRFGVLEILKDSFDDWVFTDLPTERGGLAADLYAFAVKAGIPEERRFEYHDFDAALEKAVTLGKQILSEGRAGTVKIVVFGSFVTVELASRRFLAAA